jgi:NADH-quinone oxidoreductase subunit J
MNFDLFDFVFIVFAALTVGAAISVLVTKDLARAAFFLAFCFIGVAITYIFLNAEFIGLIQILVYVGAINVLILFGIMITKTKLRGGGACE